MPQDGRIGQCQPMSWGFVAEIGASLQTGGVDAKPPARLHATVPIAGVKVGCYDTPPNPHRGCSIGASRCQTGGGRTFRQWDQVGQKCELSLVRSVRPSLPLWQLGKGPPWGRDTSRQGSHQAKSSVLPGARKNWQEWQAGDKALQKTVPGRRQSVLDGAPSVHEGRGDCAHRRALSCAQGVSHPAL
jgi:hypothetical protein